MVFPWNVHFIFNRFFMPNRKLLEITSALNSNQQKRLRYFLQSPYYNQGYNAQQILDLFEIVLLCKSDEEHPKLDKKRLSGQFFPHKPFREKAKNPIDSLSSDLLRLVRKFITVEDIEPEHAAAQEHLSLARFYRHNNLEDRFWQNIEQWRKTMAAFPYRENLYFLYNFYMEEEISAFQSIFNTYSGDANFVSAHHYLDSFYLLNKLEFTCALVFQSMLGTNAADTPPELNSALIAELQRMPAEEQPLRNLYRQILHLLQNREDEPAFVALEQSLSRYEAEISPIKFRNLQAYYRYFAGSRFMLRNGTGGLQQLFDLYRRHLDAGYLFVDGKLMPVTLKSLVNLALKLGHIDWAEQFLEEMDADRITGTKYTQEAHQLCLAEVKFYKKEYDKASELLIYRHFENVHYSIVVDVLQIKIYFETDDELIEARLQALMKKVRRAQISKEFKELYLNFIKILDKIARYRWVWTDKKRASLQTEIKGSSAILEREWLLSLLTRK
jgi:hypothetical protein